MSSHILELTLTPSYGGYKVYVDKNKIISVYKYTYMIEGAVWEQRKGFIAWLFNLCDKVKDDVTAEGAYLKLTDNTSYAVKESVSMVLDMWEGETHQKYGL